MKIIERSEVLYVAEKNEISVNESFVALLYYYGGSIEWI